MDLLLISTRPPYPPQTQQQALLYYFSQEMAGRRAVIDLLSFRQQPEEIANIPRYERFFREVRLIPEPKRDVQKRNKHSSRHFPTTSKDAWSPPMWEAVKEKLASSHYDVVQLFGGVEVYEYAHLLSDLPTVIIPLMAQKSQHSIQAGGWWGRRRAKQRAQAMQQCEKWIYQNYARTIVTTPHEADLFRAAGIQASVVHVPLGIDTDYYKPTGYEPRVTGLLFIGDFSQESDLQAARILCQKIFPAVKGQLPEAVLYLAGSSPPPEFYAFASNSIIIVENVIDYRPLFELATVYVSPVRQYSGFRQELLQAAAMITPIVATPESCAGIALQPGRDFLQVGPPTETAQEIVRLLQDSQLRLKLQLNARERVELNYAWHKIVDQYEDLYQEIMASRSGN